MNLLKPLDRCYAAITGKLAYAFQVGDHVEEVVDYCPEVGIVIGRFRSMSGKPHYVVEYRSTTGRLYYRVRANDELRHF